MLDENPLIISAIDRIAALSREVGPRIWKIHGEAINSAILKDPLSDTGRATAEICISLWNGSQSVNLQDLFRYDLEKFKEVIAALASTRPESEDLYGLAKLKASDLIPPGNAMMDDVAIVNIKPE